MKKINTFSNIFSKSMDILTYSQMSAIKGGAISTLIGTPVDMTAVTVVSITADDKRRDRPGGGISTH